MKELLAELQSRLHELDQRNLLRRLSLPAGRDFCSNDYLGLSSHPAIARSVAAVLSSGPAGAPASRLLRGHTAAHAALERQLAEYKGAEAALLFPSGYQANLAVLSTLVTPRDRVITDRLNHASIIDGLRLARCRKVIVPHLDEAAVERALAETHPAGRTFVVTESLFSMDGDVAPLDRYAALADRYGAALIVDDAHATGLYGSRGSGLAEHFGIAGQCVALVSTFGKAFGLHGAFVAGPRVVIDFLVNRARPFVFSTATAPLVVAALRASLEVAQAEPARREAVHALAGRLRRHLRDAGLDCGRSSGPIVPVILGDNLAALNAAAALQQSGFDVRAIRPPTVEPGTARLRISVHADHTEPEIDSLAAALVSAVALPASGPSR